MKKRIRMRGYKKRKTFVKKRQGRRVYKQKLPAQGANLYKQGFNAGYDDAMLKMLQSAMPEAEEAWKQSAKKDYLLGHYHGGEGIVDSLLPELEILPDISVRQIIEAGLEQMRSQFYRLQNPEEVAGQLMNALDTRSPLSIVRLGDGELLTLAQELVMDGEQVRKEGHFLGYAGIQLPDLSARDQLAQSIRSANIVGIPKFRLPNFQPLTFSVFKAHGIDYRHLQLTLSTINYALNLQGFYPKLLANRRVLIVGNKAPELAQVLANNGIYVAGAIAPVQGMPDVPRVMGEISARDFDIALVGAGVPAVVIVQRIGSELGKVAIDFGHLADALVRGEVAL